MMMMIYPIPHHISWFNQASRLGPPRICPTPVRRVGVGGRSSTPKKGDVIYEWSLSDGGTGKNRKICMLYCKSFKTLVPYFNYRMTWFIPENSRTAAADSAPRWQNVSPEHYTTNNSSTAFNLPWTLRAGEGECRGEGWRSARQSCHRWWLLPQERVQTSVCTTVASSSSNS